MSEAKRLFWWSVAAVVVAAFVLMLAGCMTPAQRTFLNAHADKLTAYVDEVNRVPVSITKEAIKTQADLSEEQKAQRLANVALIEQYGASLKEDAATIKRVWPEE